MWNLVAFSQSQTAVIVVKGVFLWPQMQVAGVAQAPPHRTPPLHAPLKPPCLPQLHAGGTTHGRRAWTCLAPGLGLLFPSPLCYNWCKGYMLKMLWALPARFRKSVNSSPTSMMKRTVKCGAQNVDKERSSFTCAVHWIGGKRGKVVSDYDSGEEGVSWECCWFLWC